MNGGTKIGACDDADVNDGNKNVAVVVVDDAAGDENVLAVPLVVIRR